MKYSIKYQGKEEVLYIYLDYQNEFSKDFLKKVKDNTIKINNSVKRFAKDINFKGHKIKIIVSGVLISTIIIAKTENDELLTNTNDDNTIYEETTDDVLNENVYFEDEEVNEFETEKFILPSINYNFLDLNDKKVGEPIIPTYIVVHNTGNDASALNEVKYLHSSSNTSYTSYHYAVDEKEIWQAIPNNYNAWHAGDGDGKDSYNLNAIAIEIARSVSTDLSVRDRAIENGAKLISKLMKQYEIPIENVVTHQDASGKFCPHDIFERYGWNNFISLVQYYYNLQ